MRPNPNDLTAVNSGKQVKSLPPKQPFVAAIGQLSHDVAGVEVDYDHFGHVRHLSTAAPQGFLTEPFRGNPRNHARQLLRTSRVSRALGLRYVDIRDGSLEELPLLGWRVEFRQVLRIKGQKRAIPVRGGFVHVYMDANGRIYQVSSTLRRGRKPSSLGKIISRDAAVAAAKKLHGSESCEKARCTLTFSAHNGKLDPVYEVTLASCAPRKVMLYLVKARGGSVVYQANKLHYGAPARSFLRIPSPSKPLDPQVYDTLIESLPDPKVLKNENLVVYLGNSRREVRAKADGTFNYKPTEPEFGCVVTFFALNSMFERFKAWGLKKHSAPIPVFVRDSSVRDNAYFDPESLEVHLGVGSGLPRGLNKNIEFDLGVGWHEVGHFVVYLQAPGKDLPGSEGGAIHESSGDYCDLLMDWLFRCIYGKQMGQELTKAEISADRRVIGIYALPPDGIRIQKNKKRTPQDKTGEVHDDGLISGGASSDMMVAMVTSPEVGIEDALASAGKLYLAALALVPAHKVLFKDLLRALITADQTLNGGSNRPLIEKAFADHGITLGAQTTLPPTLPRRRPRRRR